MEKRKKWYEKRGLWIVFGFIAIFVIPLIINWCYLKCDIWPTDWNGDSALLFYGSVLSLIGTLLLSYIAIWQNKQAKDINDRMLKIEEEKYTPILDVVREKCKITENENSLKIMLYIRNITNYPIHNISLSLNPESESTVISKYSNGTLQKEIMNELKSVPANTKDRNYKLTKIAGLREIDVTHYKTRKGVTEEITERLPYSEYLYFDIEKNQIDKPLKVYITMQNMFGAIFMQTMLLYIVKRQDNNYIIAMNSKKLKKIGEVLEND